jgi:hypothetical protein
LEIEVAGVKHEMVFPKSIGEDTSKMWTGDATYSNEASYLWFGNYRIYTADLSIEHFVGLQTIKLGKMADTLEATKQFVENQSRLED